MTDPQTPDFGELIARASEVQAQLQAAQEEILRTEITGTAGGGLVSVTMTGGGEMTDITIKPEAVNPEDVETLQDLVLAAFRDGHNKASELASEKIAPFTQGPGPDHDLGSLFNQ